MRMGTPRWARPLTMAVFCVLTTASAALLGADGELRPDYRPPAYAIVNAKIHGAANAEIESGTVIVRNGIITAVGKTAEVEVPADAETIDAKGMIVYPGFVDMYTTLGVPAGVTRSTTGSGRAVPYVDFALPRTPIDNRNGITPEFEVAAVLDLPDSTIEERRKLGFTDVLSAPGGAIAAGQSALVTLSGLPRRESVVKTPVGLHVLLANPAGFGFSEGNTCLDDTEELNGYTAAAPVQTPEEALEARRRAARSAGYPLSLMGVIAHLRQAMLDAEYQAQCQTYFEQHGGNRPALDPALASLHAARSRDFPVFYEANTRDEIHRVLDLAAEFGTRPVVVGGREAAKVADRLKAENVPVVLRVDFPEEPKVPSESEFRKRESEQREIPLKVLADRNAKWKERVATAANLQKAGVKFAFSSEGLSKADTFHAQMKKLIAAGLSPDAAVDGLTISAAEIAGVSPQLGSIEVGKLGHLVVMSAPYGEEKAKARFLLTDGYKFDLEKLYPTRKTADGKDKSDATGKDKSEAKEKDKEKAESEKAATKDETPRPDPARPKGEPAKTAKADAEGPAEPFLDSATEFDEDRRPKMQTGGTVLIKDAMILTVSEAGSIPKGSILVRDGKIAAIGPDLVAPPGVTVIDGTGLVAMPGIIDTHSHMAIQGGVNEATLSIVPEVRVADVVDGEDITIYNALAGGTTTARLLHGSANTIGGQDVVIKLRFGLPGRDLILRDDQRPQGVKFALGENVTRSRGRFPNTRMGVEATIERAFLEGKAYGEARKSFETAKAEGKVEPPFRRDLRLEALAAIVDGRFKIHSHCYRSDEILMLLRTAEKYGIKVQSLQHVLEGYKVAAEIAAHGASASTFSDWWAYKIEAFDAIPFNAALLTEAGANVCIKSDSEELVRHLYLEAAKMIRYGNVGEQKALEMVTLNPAKELGLDHRLGTLEVGKDADIALFDGHPFDTYARCRMTLVDGEVRFMQRESDPKPVSRTFDRLAKGPEAVLRSPAPEIVENPRGLYALTGARLHPVTGEEIANGTLVIADGKIAAIGGPETIIPEGAQTMDCKGLDVWPGMIDAGSVVGIFEVGSLTETQDVADSAQFQPELRTSTAIHSDSELIPVTRANGVLASYVQPSGGTISGQGCVISLDGWVPSEMVVADSVALNVNIPSYVVPRAEGSRGRGPAGGGDDPNAKRKERLAAIADEFQAALRYAKVVEAARAGKVEMPSPDPRLAALRPFAAGEKLVIFNADRRTEILDALTLISDLKLKGVITGGSEAWRVTDELKAAKVPVLLAGTLRIPSDRNMPYDTAYTTPLRLQEAGVPFAIRTIGQGADQATSSRNLPFEAAFAVSYGLSESDALRAVTLAPAQILGVADRLGSLEVGKIANLVITQGPLLQVTSDVKTLFIQGQPIAPDSRHTRLYAKYRERLAEVRAGRAPLGLVRSAKPADRVTPMGGTAAPAATSGTR